VIFDGYAKDGIIFVSEMCNGKRRESLENKEAQSHMISMLIIYKLEKILIAQKISCKSR
jgi:hypothetical protein